MNNEVVSCGRYREDPYITDFGEPRGQCANCGGLESDHTVSDKDNTTIRFGLTTGEVNVISG